MPRPQTKTDLVKLSKLNFKRLNDLVDSYSLEEQQVEFPKGTMNRNIRDVLAHLHQWHTMMMEWYEIGMKGEKPEIPAKGYTWKTLPDLNRVIWKKYNHVDLKKIIKWLNESFNQVQKLIAQHTDKELFEKKRYKWTGSTSLGAYFISATSSHYDWAFKLIRRYKK
ncbi:MAG: ClbS/DfsB family four-helix bundle protein [Cyclobacteriaceae bacterium]